MFLFLVWVVGRMVVLFIEIGKIEGRIDFVGEDDEFSFGRDEF